MEKKDSKAELLYSAFCEFAKNGFFGAKTRDIAKRANINISSILYYFGGKEGIYTAALESIVETVNQLTADLVKQYEQVMINKDKQKATQLIKDFVREFIYICCSEQISKEMRTVFFSEYSKPYENFNILYDGLICPFHKKMANLLRLASEDNIMEKDAYLFTFPIFAQIFVFGSRKDTICKFMEWKNYEDAEKTRLVEYMNNQIDALISGHLPK